MKNYIFIYIYIHIHISYYIYIYIYIYILEATRALRARSLLPPRRVVISSSKGPQDRWPSLS